MNSKPPGRIPFEDVHNAKSWVLPAVNGRLVNGDEQKARKTKASQNKARQHQRTEPEKPVISENIDTHKTEKNNRITAQQLEEITLAAEQDGFAKGHSEGLEQGHIEGRKAGYSDGLKAGTEQALSEHGQWLKEQGQYLEQVCQALMAPLAQQQEQLANAALDLAMGLAQHLLDAELTLKPERIAAVVDKALAALPHVDGQIHVFLHPDDVSAFSDFAPNAHQYTLQADTGLARGSCRVQSDISYVDYSVAARLHEFTQALRDKPFDLKASELPIVAPARELAAHLKSTPSDAVTPASSIGANKPQVAAEKPNFKPEDDDA